MPRASRKMSGTGFYHVVTKGDGSQVLFESDHAREKYLGMMIQAASDYAVEVHAYCLMDNHIHLLIRDEHGALCSFMKQLNERYAMYFAWSTKRVGHVFQGRFWSEPVETDEHFLATLRYIHANPEPAGICRLDQYPWSSYQLYIRGTSLIETDFALALIGSRTSFSAFSAPGGKYPVPFPGSTLRKHLSTDELNRIAGELIGSKTLLNLKTLSPLARAVHVERLAEAGFTVREISRITGLGCSSIRYSLQLCPQ